MELVKTRKLSDEAWFTIVFVGIILVVIGLVIILNVRKSYQKEEEQRITREKSKVYRTDRLAIMNELKEASRPKGLARFKQGDIVTIKSSKQKGQVTKVFWHEKDETPEWVYSVRFFPEDKISEMRAFEMDRASP